MSATVNTSCNIEDMDPVLNHGVYYWQPSNVHIYIYIYISVSFSQEEDISRPTEAPALRRDVGVPSLRVQNVEYIWFLY